MNKQLIKLKLFIKISEYLLIILKICKNNSEIKKNKMKIYFLT